VSSFVSQSKSTLTDSISASFEFVEDENAVTVQDVYPSTPPQVVHHQAPQAQAANQIIDLTDIDTSAVHGHAFLMAGIPTTTTGESQVKILSSLTFR
jgi:hypothetical protein